MKLYDKFVISGLLCLLAIPAQAQVASEQSPGPAAGVTSSAETASLQKTAKEVEARIRAKEGDTDLLKKAIKTNEVALAREILVRNGFTARDLENAKISLRTGGGKGGEDSLEISVTCCDPKEITIQRTLENFTKASP